MSKSIQNQYYLNQYQAFSARTTAPGKNIEIQARTVEDAEYEENLEAASFNDEELGYVDQFETEESSLVKAPAAVSISEQQHRLGDLLAQLSKSPKILGADRKRLAGAIRETQKLLAEADRLESSAEKAAQLGALDAEITALEAEILGRPVVEDEFGISEEIAPAVDVASALESFLAEVENAKNLNEADKTALRAKVEKWKHELDLNEADATEILAQLDELKQGVEEKSAYSPVLRALAQTLELEPEEIQAKAQAAGIDLEHLSLPPKTEFLHFLQELSPGFKEKLEAVEAAIQTRAQKIENLIQEAKGQSTHNEGGSDSNTDDNREVKTWQQLFDLKYHQDEASHTIAMAMREVVEFLLPILQAAYPDQEVRALESGGASGWKKVHQGYLKADKIQIGKLTLDLFNNTDGKAQLSLGHDAEPDFEIPKLAFDAEGDGAWNPYGLAEGVQAYDENMVDYLYNYDRDKEREVDSQGRLIVDDA